MSALIVSALSPKKEKKVQKIESASILDRGNKKYWIVRYTVIFEDGSVKTKEASTKVGKKEKSFSYMQRKFLPAWIIKQEQKINNPSKQNVKFKFFADMYLNECQDLEDLYAITLRVNRVLQDFANRDIRTISKSDVKHYILKLTDKRTGKFLGNNSRKKYLGIFRGIFRQAVESNCLDKNTIDEIELRQKHTRRNLEEVQPFEPHEVTLLLEYAKTNNYGQYMFHYLSLAFYQGMSPSEILGLQIGDIDFDSMMIFIRRDISKGKVKGTKNAYRERHIPIFEITVPTLQDLIKKAKSKHTLWLFSKSNGSHLYDIATIRGAKRLETKNGKQIRKDRNWYKLIEDCQISYRHIKNTRHTFAVRMLELSASNDNAITPQAVANILGHGSLKMLHEHYAKWLDGKSKSINRSLNIYT